MKGVFIVAAACAISGVSAFPGSMFGKQSTLETNNLKYANIMKSSNALTLNKTLQNNMLSAASKPVPTDGYIVVKNDAIPNTQLRLIHNTLPCNDGANHYAGYLDVYEGLISSHLYFTFYEAREDPDSKPLAIFMNGGPGSATTNAGFYFEGGPCVMHHGTNLEINEYSFNKFANYIFIDQPNGVGYSYGTKLTWTSEEVGEEIYKFIQLFYKQFPEFQKRDLHVTGESYGGMYVPNIANTIINKNNANASNHIEIPLKSVLIGNGYTDPGLQTLDYYNYSCTSQYKFNSDSDCETIRGSHPQCEASIQLCQASGKNYLACQYQEQIGCRNAQASSSNLNPYDTREVCSSPDDLCYPQMTTISKWLNEEGIKTAHGVPQYVDFHSDSDVVGVTFTLSGDQAYGSSNLIPKILAAGVRYGGYDGVYDSVCDWIGYEDVFNHIDFPGAAEFRSTPYKPFVSVDGKNGGEFRSYGSGAGTLTYIKVWDAGHLVPYNQPAVALTIYEKWMNNQPLA